MPQGTFRAQANGIDERGDIIGEAVYDGTFRAVTWIRDAPGEHGHEKVYRMVPLPLPPNATSSVGHGIAGTGAVGEVHIDDSPAPRAVKWTTDGQVVDPGVPAGRASSSATRISSNGWIAGRANGDDPDKEIPTPASRWSLS
ncbi:hypothetical protein [Kibdelosporangium phytohabitans]|uniref:Uncharacterized protein n=1 Tax=Kibdelosporangium phytohabitans TaxID=860235 RepID=A0A0N9IA74_9PSEU|nr:hypothetical protein [Kibdelosporangium phytohabitans]ALG11627.1 hypothetical protein AOZ06_36405 [Kibdelosporangium phytohabitans]MBE1463006.1 hypothetical protein [Kibdelosporangium phytohabitans]